MSISQQLGRKPGFRFAIVVVISNISAWDFIKNGANRRGIALLVLGAYLLTMSGVITFFWRPEQCESCRFACR